MTDGVMGDAPEWWGLVQAARFLNVPPWELMERSSFWRDVALSAINSENRWQEHAAKAK